MEPNNRNNRNRGDKNRRRGGGMWSIVLWALLPVSYTHLTLPTIYSV